MVRPGGNAGAVGNQDGDGPRSTPATDGQNVYVFDGHMLLTCLDGATGDIQWQRDVLNEYGGTNIRWGNAISPVLDGENVYVSGGGNGSSFLAFDKVTGKELWKAGSESVTHATPRLARFGGQRQLIHLTESGLVSIAPTTGQEIWRAQFQFTTSSAASPVVDGNLVYCSAGYSVGAGLFEIAAREDGFHPRQLWYKRNKLMNHWSTPTVHDGYVYGLFGYRKYATAPLECIDLQTGETKWSERGFGLGNCIIVNDKLLILADDGRLITTEATPDGYKELGSAQVIDGKCWSTPAFADGHVFVRSTKEGACFDLFGR